MLTPLQRQVKEGIDAVIVDSVLAIRQGLTTARGPHGEPVNGAPTPLVAATKLTEPSSLDLASSERTTASPLKT